MVWLPACTPQAATVGWSGALGMPVVVGGHVARHKLAYQSLYSKAGHMYTKECPQAASIVAFARVVELVV